MPVAGKDAVMDAALAEGEAHVRATVVDGENLVVKKESDIMNVVA